MSKVCAVCGKTLMPYEIRLNESSLMSPSKRLRYLCSQCRKREYEEYVRAVKELIEKS